MEKVWRQQRVGIDRAKQAAPSDNRKSRMKIAIERQGNLPPQTASPGRFPKTGEAVPCRQLRTAQTASPCWAVQWNATQNMLFSSCSSRTIAVKKDGQLQYSLAQTERDRRCIRRAVFLVVMLSMLSLAGLSYCAILLPEALYQSKYHVLPGLGGLGLGSVISLVVFLGYLFWNRAVVSRLHGECRLRVLAKLHFKESGTPTPAVGFSGASPGGSGSLPARQVGMPQDGRVS